MCALSPNLRTPRSPSLTRSLSTPPHPLFPVPHPTALPTQKKGDSDDASTTTSSSSSAAATTTASSSSSSAWHDDDDDDVSVDVTKSNRLRKLRDTEDEEALPGNVYAARLREQFAATNGGAAPEWAKLSKKKKKKKKKTRSGEEGKQEGEGEDASEGEDDGEGGSEYGSDDDDEASALLRGSSRLLGSGGKGGRLPGETLAVERLKDANRGGPSKCVIQAAKFHPNGQLLMTAGFDKSLRLFQVDGSTNEMVQSTFLTELPIHTAAFTLGGARIVASGRRKFFYSYDVAAGKIMKVPGILGRAEKSLEKFVAHDNTMAFFGKAGEVILVSATTCQWMHTLKMGGSIRSASFASNGTELMTAGTDGEIYLWDLRMNRCVSRIADEGASPSTAVAASPDNQYVACGSESGVVNLYDGVGSIRAAATAAVRGFGVPSVKPIKAVMNLTTPIDVAEFNSDGQILAIASRRKKDSLKLVHTPSRTVFSNWPSGRTPLHYVSTVDFSPNSGLLAIGNSRGRVLLYRLNHYSRA